jgi:hypothetical protein
MRALHSIIKTHVNPGSVVFSDDASQYTIKHGGRSQLCDLGYYHFWVNHSREYVNDKFPFITTCNIERNWCNMKRQATGVARVRNNGAIQDYLDAFSMTECVKRNKLP